MAIFTESARYTQGQNCTVLIEPAKVARGDACDIPDMYLAAEAGRTHQAPSRQLGWPTLKGGSEAERADAPFDVAKRMKRRASLRLGSRKGTSLAMLFFDSKMFTYLNSEGSSKRPSGSNKHPQISQIARMDSLEGPCA